MTTAERHSQTTPSAAVRPAGFAHAEMCYLLQTAGAGPDSVARHQLQMPVSIPDEVITAGLASLFAHGGVSEEAGRLRIVGDAVAVMYVLAKATDWTMLALQPNDDREQVFHVISCPDAVFIAHERGLGVLEFVGVKPGHTHAQAVMDLLVQYLADGTSVVVLDHTVAGRSATGGLRGSGIGSAVVIERASGPLSRDDVRLACIGRETPHTWRSLGTGDVSDLLSWVALDLGARDAGGEG